MKKQFLLSILVSITFSLSSQTVRILFDATKAETAGNADWVIDADSHNIGYNSGPAVQGQGNESNAQRFPFPDQSSVNSTTPQEYWNGGISAWGIDLAKKGFIVESLPYNGSITYNNSSNLQDLKNFKVFIVCEPNIVFTSTEKTAILQFVQNGGGLFIVSDHDVSDRNNDGWDSPHIWNDLMSNNSIQDDPFGFTFDYTSFSQTSSNIPNLPTDPLLHGIMGNITKVQWNSGTSMTLTPENNSTVKGVVYKTGASFGDINVLVAYSEFGQGKVVGIGDSSPCDDGSGDSNDQLYDGWIADASGNHERLIMNATLWLTSDSSVGLENEIGRGESFRLIQNPVLDYLRFTNSGIGNEKADAIIIYDIEGQIILEKGELNEENISIPISSIKPGLYFYQILNGKRSFTSGKFFKL